jgi:hypothetical protein
MIDLISQIRDAEENFKLVVDQRDKLHRALQMIIEAYEYNMVKSTLDFRITLAKNALKDVRIK